MDTRKHDFTKNEIGLIRPLCIITMSDASFLEYRPSCIAAVAILSAARDLPIFSFLSPEYAESWCDGLHRVRNIMHNTFVKSFN